METLKYNIVQETSVQKVPIQLKRLERWSELKVLS